MAQIARDASPLDSAFRLTRRRLVPFLLLMYVLSFLDRANIGFAKQAFQASVGMRPGFSSGNSIPVFLPRPNSEATLEIASMPSLFPRV